MDERPRKRVRFMEPDDSLGPPPPPEYMSEPAVLYKIKEMRRPENWQFIRLVPRSHFVATPAEQLTSDEAAHAY